MMIVKRNAKLFDPSVSFICMKLIHLIPLRISKLIFWRSLLTLFRFKHLRSSERVSYELSCLLYLHHASIAISSLFAMTVICQASSLHSLSAYLISCFSLLPRQTSTEGDRIIVADDLRMCCCYSDDFIESMILFSSIRNDEILNH